MAPPRFPVQLLMAVAVALPGAYLGAAEYLALPHPQLPPPLAAVVFGVAIIGAAFVLSWAAEAAQVDISAGAAIALLAVLPEYAVDFVFTYQAGQVYADNGMCVPGPGGADPCSLALANMTGANRVLVGIGWPLVVLVAIFVAYAWRISQAPAEEPDLVGVSAWVGTKSHPARRNWYVAMFVVSGLFILATAEHFANGLVETGSTLGIDQFLLVQWVAPLASESPELIVACLYATRLKASHSLGTLLSSKVNQWALLVGTLPIVFAISATTFDGLPIDTNQRFELLITAAQSLFAVSLLVNLGLTVWGAAALFVLFSVQFVASITLSAPANRTVIIVLSVVYGALAVGLLLRRRRAVRRIVRDGLVTPFHELVGSDR